MFGISKRDASVTLIAAGTEIAGDLRFSHHLYLNGRVQGDVIALEGGEATVVVSETALVRGDIRAPNVVISGRVEGNVRASGRVELTARAHVIGNVHYRLMEMQLGAVVEGQLLHHEGAEDPGAADSGEPPRQAAESALKTVSSSGHGASG